MYQMSLACEVGERRIELVEQRPLDITEVADRRNVFPELLHVQRVGAAPLANCVAEILRRLLQPPDRTLSCFALREDVGSDGEEGVEAWTIHYWVAVASGSNLPAAPD